MLSVIVLVVGIYIIYLVSRYPDDNDTLLILSVLGGMAVFGSLQSIVSWSRPAYVVQSMGIVFIVAMESLATYRAKRSWGRAFSYWRLTSKVFKGVMWAIAAWVFLIIVHELFGSM